MGDAPTLRLMIITRVVLRLCVERKAHLRERRVGDEGDEVTPPRPSQRDDDDDRARARFPDDNAFVGCGDAVGGLDEGRSRACGGRTMA